MVLCSLSLQVVTRRSRKVGVSSFSCWCSLHLDFCVCRQSFLSTPLATCWNPRSLGHGTCQIASPFLHWAFPYSSRPAQVSKPYHLQHTVRRLVQSSSLVHVHPLIANCCTLISCGYKMQGWVLESVQTTSQQSQDQCHDLTQHPEFQKEQRMPWLLLIHWKQVKIYVIRALKNWEPQQLQLGLHLKQRGQAIGHQSQFLFGQGRHLRTACYERWMSSS